MTVKDLLMRLPASDIADTLVQHYYAEDEEKRKKASEVYTNFIHSLSSIEPVDSGHLLLGIRYLHNGVEELEPMLFRKDDLRTRGDSPFMQISSVDELSEDEIEQMSHFPKCVESYAFEFSPWNEILGYEVLEENLCDVDPVRLSAEIVWAMTFFGLTEADAEKERRELEASLAESDRISQLPPEERKNYYVSAEEVLANLGYVDTRTEEEKTATDRSIRREVLANMVCVAHTLTRYGL